MRRLRYCVAMSLDGYIAGPKGEYDWIIMDGSFDFEAFFKQFDTLLMGRRTFEFTQQGPGPTMPGMQTVVCSRTLRAKDHPELTIVSDARKAVSTMKSKPGKDIWLFGGGDLFRSLLDAGLVDTVEVSVMPMLLSQGVPLLPAGKRSPRLRLTESKVRSSGILGLTYALEKSPKRRRG